jgi:hypothetical protein
MITRADGWPLCPLCGGDEVYCLQMPACICGDMRCYACKWHGDPRAEHCPPEDGAEVARDVAAFSRFCGLFRWVPADMTRPSGMGSG